MILRLRVWWWTVGFWIKKFPTIFAGVLADTGAYFVLELRQRGRRGVFEYDKEFVLRTLDYDAPGLDPDAYLKRFFYAVLAAHVCGWREQTWLAHRIRTVLERHRGVKITHQAATEALQGGSDTLYQLFK